MDLLAEQLELCDQLLVGRNRLLQPQDLPGRYGRAVKALDHLLQVMNCEALLAGGWAVWFHGFLGRMTQDIDILLPANRIEEFLQVAGVGGFEVLPQPPGRWPKIMHKETNIKVDILPEGARPGTVSRPAPTTIPSPLALGARPGPLAYVSLPTLIELKLAAGRARDEADVVELIRANPNHMDAIQRHLENVHPDYLAAFHHWRERAREQRDE